MRCLEKKKEKSRKAEQQQTEAPGRAGERQVARMLRLSLTQRGHVHKEGVGGEGREMSSGGFLGKRGQEEERTVQGYVERRESRMSEIR